MKARAILRLLFPVVALATAVPPLAAQTATSSTPAKITCSIDGRSASEADMALWEHRYPDAATLYGKALAADPNAFDAMAGLVRTTLAEGKLPEALALAVKYDAAHPNNTVLLDALGEARFRRGEVGEAANAFNAALHIDICSALTHFGMYRFLQLSGMYAIAQKHLDMAHNLAPNNPWIKQRWYSSHAVPMTADERLAQLNNRLENPALTPEVKESVQAAIAGIKARERGDCQLVTPVTGVKLPMVPISNGMSITPQDMYAAGLNVDFNGKRKRLEIDTGASGLLLSRSVAKSAGLVPELETQTSGIGDEGPASSFVTHVDDIRIGPMEFKNCMVHVLEKSSVLDVDGLIGPDVFRNYLVTLDIPGREVRIAPLPARPGDTAATLSLDTWDADQAQLSVADRARDRYIAPEMKDWTPVFRYGHDIIVPTFIGNAPVKLFLMDTGAAHGMISPDAAREITKVSGDTNARVKGLSGEVKNVLVADKVSITFANVRQITEGMTAYDSSVIGRGSGVEISGIIGFPTLRELVISIDYRDNLIHVVYNPNQGYHYSRP